MLILSRKLNESIVINDNIVVTLVEASHGKVRLGIEAPPEVPVFRQEIHDAIRSGQKDPKAKKLPGVL